MIELDQIKGNLLAIDSCPMLAKVKENNLKDLKSRIDLIRLRSPKETQIVVWV